MRDYSKQEQELVLKMIGLGINISAKGFDYILDAVKIIHDTNGNIKIMDLYHEVARINNAKYRNVENCIRVEADRVYKINSDVSAILAADPNNGKLTNGEFLYRLAYWLYK